MPKPTLTNPQAACIKALLDWPIETGGHFHPADGIPGVRSPQCIALERKGLLKISHTISTNLTFRWSYQTTTALWLAYSDWYNDRGWKLYPE